LIDSLVVVSGRMTWNPGQTQGDLGKYPDWHVPVV